MDATKLSRRLTVGVMAMLALAACGSPAPTLAPTAGLASPTVSPPTVTQPSPTTAIETAAATGSTEPPEPETPRPTREPRPTPGEGTHLPLVVDEQGYTAVSGEAGDYATYGAVLTNPNTEWAVYRMLIQINLFDANDQFVGGAEVNVTVLPGQTTAVAGQAFGAGSAVRMLVAIPEDPTPYFAFTSSGTIEVTDAAMTTNESTTITSGSLTSSLTSDQSFLQLFVLYRDADGAIVGGTAGGVETLESGATVPFEIQDAPAPSGTVSADVYWQLGGQLP